MSRRVCAHCGFPMRVCLCAELVSVMSQTRVWVLQHPSEVEHGKNSARLLPLLLPAAEIFVGESEADFSALRDRLVAERLKPVLVYPSEQESQAFTDSDTDDRRVLLLLDGTWRKALKMYHLNPWLQQLPHLSLQPGKPSAYLIRKASRADSLSTLEAAAEALSILEPSLDVTPLHTVFAAMVRRRIDAMPAEVRKRYGLDESNRFD
ncbi:DTW domain-containing protein [Shewanella sp. JM162201]|uniref:tRNA-uridine aminocarboxypropyltransferase n=1 Tax=Shewanella jiangmenensis TaxID=2837387 RepID=A0ABS5V451_9GAMM|nr:DTW domain-containing protein [Shewanella jiangmenensis]